MIDHRPFEKTGSGKHAVLLLHGIASSPGHFRNLVPVIPESFSIYNILLDGHNGTVEAFGHTSMAKWKAQVKATLCDLFSKHDKVVIVAHSMGTLFAIQAAIDHPDRVPCLFLLAVPTRPWVRFSTICTALRVAFGKTDPAAAAMRSDTGIALTPQLWKYLCWVPRMAELLAECRRVRKQLPRLTVPTQVFQSKVDELVSIRSYHDLIKNPQIAGTVLTGSGHFLYGTKDTVLLQTQLRKVLEEAEAENEKTL